MGLMKIGGGSALLPNLPVALPGGGTFTLPAGQGIVGQFGGVVAPALGTNNPLSGQYLLQLGLLSVLQMLDPGLNYWRNVNVLPLGLATISSDGTNFRVANTTGCPVAALITAAGAAGTNGFYGFNNSGQAIVIQNGIIAVGNAIFTITPNIGGSQWNAIVGGAVNTTMSFAGTVFNGNLGVNNAFGAAAGGVVASAGSNYLKPPIIVFSPPPNQGQQPYILPTATCTIAAGAINAITVVQQGAGLLGLPGIAIVPQPGDTTGGGAVIGWLTANATNVGTGTLLAMWPMFYGTPQTVVVTFAFGGSSNPAPTVTAIMNFTVTSVTNTTPGAGYTAAYGLWQGGVVAGAAANTNPAYDKGIGLPVFPPIVVAAATGVTTLAGPFGGVNIQAVPTLAYGTQLAAGTVATVAVQTPVVGGANDTSLIQSF